jgi:hypothetical protein
MKRLHVVILGALFILGMEEISLYFVGLMFFFVLFTASTNDYRKYGFALVYYAAFFIWIAYFWSVISYLFDPKGVVYKLFMMFTFTTAEPEPLTNSKFLVLC